MQMSADVEVRKPYFLLQKALNRLYQVDNKREIVERAWVSRAEPSDVPLLWLCRTYILWQEAGTPVSRMVNAITNYLSGHMFVLWPCDSHSKIQSNHRFSCLPFSCIDLHLFCDFRSHAKGSPWHHIQPNACNNPRHPTLAIYDTSAESPRSP